MTTGTEVAQAMPESMFNRGKETQDNVMESIHSMKIYNSPPNEVADVELEGSIMIKNSNTEGSYVKFTDKVNINILRIRKAINGSYPIRDANGELVKDNSGNTQRGFAFTEEFGRFTKNIDDVFFKNGNQIIKTELGSLKNLIRTPEVNGIVNHFYKKGVSQDGEEYNGSHLKDSYIIYGVFKDGEYAGEYFRLFLSNSSFGITWKDGAKCDPEKGSLAAALNVGFSLFKEFKDSQGIQGSFDDSLLDVTLGVKASGKFFKADITNTKLPTYDNTEDFNFINELCAEYKRTTFNVETKDNIKLDSAPAVAGAIQGPTEDASKEQVEPNEGISIEDIPF